MRIVALVFAILGALAALGIGGLTLVGTSTFKESPQYRMAMERISSSQFPETVRKQARAALGRLQALPYFLIAAVPLAIIGGMLAMERRGLWAALLLLLGAVGPVALAAGYVMALEDLAPPPGQASPAVTLLTLTGIPGALLILGALFACFCKRLPEPGPSIPRESRHHDAD